MKSICLIELTDSLSASYSIFLFTPVKDNRLISHYRGARLIPRLFREECLPYNLHASRDCRFRSLSSSRIRALLFTFMYAVRGEVPQALVRSFIVKSVRPAGRTTKKGGPVETRLVDPSKTISVLPFQLLPVWRPLSPSLASLLGRFPRVSLPSLPSLRSSSPVWRPFSR